MKILLIQPPVEDFYQTPIRRQPIGLAYIASSLKTAGHDVEILDCQAGRKRNTPIPYELSYLKDFYPYNDLSPFKLYSGYYHFGMGWEEIRKMIEASQADIFGISSNFTPYHQEALKVAKIIKQWNKGKIVIMGGSHVSSDPEGVLKNPSVDYVIMGEGEFRLPLLIERIENGKVKEIEGMDGVGYRNSGDIRINPLESFIKDLNSIPYPSIDLLDLDRYKINGKRSTMIITSRGCPHGCEYCSTHLTMGSYFRARSPENIIREMIECHSLYDIKAFDIEDDNFTFDRKRAREILNLIIKTFGENRIELFAMNGVSFASLDKELMSLMKRAGFRTLNLSLVSVYESTKQRLKRPGPYEDFGNILDDAEEEGLNVIAYAILGIPGQTIEEMVDTLIYLMGKRVLLGPSIYYPAPGTPLFERCKREAILPPFPSQWRSTAFPIETSDFTRLDLITILRLSRLINFIKGRIDSGDIEEGITLKGLIQFLKEKVRIDTNSGIHTKDSPWMKLLLMVLNEKAFFSLRRDSNKGFSFIREKTSKRILDYFILNSLERIIRGSK